MLYTIVDTTHLLYNKAQISCLFFFSLQVTKKGNTIPFPPITVYFA